MMINFMLLCLTIFVLRDVESLKSGDGSIPKSCLIREIFSIFSEEKVLWTRTSDEVQEVKKEIGAMKKKLDALSKNDNDCKFPIAFFAKNLRFATVSGGGRLKYDTEVTDTCNTFDKATGTFICPKPGVYVFHFFALNNKNKIVYLQLHKNGQQIIRLYADDKGSYETGGNSVVLYLEKGDQVYIHIPPGYSFTLHQNYNTFSGYMIS